MSRVDTERDARFSEPDAPATSWDVCRDILQGAELAWLSTVRADGRPHVTPVVTVWFGDALYFTSGPDEQKVRNLDHNTQVAVTTGANTWEHGIDVVVEGRARRVSDADLLEGLAAAWRRRWDGRWVYKPRDGVFHHTGGGVSNVYEVVPTKVLAFSKSPFAQTRHQFRDDAGGTSR